MLNLFENILIGLPGRCRSIIAHLVIFPLMVWANEWVAYSQDLSTDFSTINYLTRCEDVPKTIKTHWAPLPAVDFTAISPDSIRDGLMDRPAGQGTNHDIDYYIGHFHQIANALRMAEPNKGFIDISVWRNIADNEPYNARVMENITTLAWFYTQEESWNPYYAHPDLRSILEAALTFWVNMQNGDGRFSEYSQNGWNLAATAFATKFMGKTLEMLETGPPIDPDIHQQVKQANRMALMVVFTSESLYNHGRRFSNQYGNAFTGALAHLDMNPDDEELREIFEMRLASSLNDFQSPAGYYYEHFGPDWSYAFGTHHSNILMAWHYARHNEAIATHYATEHERFIDWLSYNAVWQPGDGFFMLHRSIESRQSRPILIRLESPLSEVVPMARAFNTTQEEANQRLIDVRHRVSSNWGNIPALQVGHFNGYSAYTFLHRDHYRWNPNEIQRMEALHSLPYMASDRFIHQRVDDITHFETTFIRRPTYYAAFSAGEQERDQQRFGLGLLWNPTVGTVFQSQSRSDDAAWGTVLHPRTTLPWESLPFDALYTIDGVEVEPLAGAHDLTEGVLEITYSLGSTGIFAGIGEKKLSFHEEIITVDVSHDGAFTENLPLVIDAVSDVYIHHASGVIQLFSNGTSGHEKLRIEIDNPEDVDEIFSLNTRNLGQGMRLKPVHIRAREKLFYTITINPQEPLLTDNTGSLRPEASSLFRVVNTYPNPMKNTPESNIVLDLDFGSDIQLEVYDVMGRKLIHQDLGYYTMGRHSINFNANDLPSGHYKVRLEASGLTQSVSVIVL